MFIKIREKIFNLTDAIFDILYGIKTNGYYVNINPRAINLGYGPTYYIYLNKLYKKYPFESRDHLVDFGCGMGRVIFVAYRHGCKNITGVEINQDMYQMALDNTKNIMQKC